MKTKTHTIPWKNTVLALAVSGITTVALGQDNNNNAQNHNVAGQPSSGEAQSQDASVNNQPPQNLPERMLSAITSQQFATDATVGGRKEIRLSEIALDKTQNPQIRNFATRIIRDHSNANNRLEQIARQENLDLPATNLFATDDPNWNSPLLTGSPQVKEGYLLTTNLPISAYQDIKHLQSLSGKDFDDAYAQGMVSDHNMTIQEFEAAQRNLTDPQLRKFATTTLPTLRMHLQMAQRLENDNGQVETPTAAQPNGYPNGRSTQPMRTQPNGQPEPSGSYIK